MIRLFVYYISDSLFIDYYVYSCKSLRLTLVKSLLRIFNWLRITDDESIYVHIYKESISYADGVMVWYINILYTLHNDLVVC